ncbi:MAG TPA: fibronectin type III domain-containing protein, partial [Dehalococcoidia bacterium]|nr:fibronectin type III domain-containing protein [Dehalococcoidia bacterium]
MTSKTSTKANQESRNRPWRPGWLAACVLLVLAAAAAAVLSAGGPGSATSFASVADAYVDQGSPDANFGTTTRVKVDNGPPPAVQRGFFRFSVQGFTEPVFSARLRLACTNGGPGGTIWTTTDAWTETGLTWNNQPPLLSQVTSLGTISCSSSGTLIDYDVTSAVTGNGIYNFAITTSSWDGLSFRSRESAPDPVLIVEAAPTSGVDQLHLSWKGDPRTTMTVMWHTPSSANAAAVQYGPTTSYGSTATGTTFPSTGEGYLHEVNLTGLSPAALHHYRVSADDGSWSEDHTFRTAPSSGDSFRFMAVADQGTPWTDGTHLQSVPVSNAMAARTQGLAFTQSAGDIWYAVSNSAEAEALVDQWFNQNQGYMSEAPFMPA